MGLLRKDYILDRWVYYASSRGKRPREFRNVVLKEEPKVCLFCPGNEKLTPKEIGRAEYKGNWTMRWFPNKFPAVGTAHKYSIKSKGFITEGYAFGLHEIIAETNHHKSQLADLPASQIRGLLEVYKVRVKELSKIKGVKYVQIFKNHGKEAGTSLVHSHSQVVALPEMPELVREEISAARRSRKCPYCDIVKLESKSKRKIFETKNILAFAPFASRFNYEAWIFTKQHKNNLEELSEEELTDLAAALKKILSRLKKINAPYNFFLHYAPGKDNLHLHFEITPRTATWAGFEFSTNSTINSVMPEDAAKFYKGK